MPIKVHAWVFGWTGISYIKYLKTISISKVTYKSLQRLYFFIRHTCLGPCKVNFVFSVKYRSSPPKKFLGRGALKICSKVTGEHPCWSVISIKLQSSFIEITFRHWCSPVNLLQIFRTSLNVCFCRVFLRVMFLTYVLRCFQDFLIPILLFL